MHSFSKRVGKCLILVLVFSVFLMVTEVNAKTKQSATGTKSLADKACENALYTDKMLTVDKQNYKIKIHSKEGKWKIKYAIDYDSTSADYSLVLGSQATPITVNYTGGNDLEISVGPGNAIFLIAEPVKNDNGKIVNTDGKALKVTYKDKDGKSATTTCKAGNVAIDNSGKLQINNTAAYISQKFADDAKVSIAVDPNSKEGKECQAMLEGKLEKDGDVYLSSQEDVDKYNAQMKSSFPYCYQGYSSTFEITAKDIEKVRKASLKAYKVYLDFVSSQKDNSEFDKAKAEIENEGYKKLTYNSKGISVETLSCKKEQTTEETAKYYTENEEVNNNACSVTCQEQIQVTYDPPVATKAGLCFQYKVTVKSKVTCKTQPKGDIKWPTPPSICSYTPICSGNENETQAGPSQDFDTCIQACDNGKYSQSCINSCYKKVYEKNNTTTKKVAATTTFSNVKKLAKENKDDPYYNIDGCKTNAQIKSNAEACAKAFYKLKQEEPLGVYQKYNGNIDWFDYIWKPDSSVAKTTGSPSGDNWIESIKRSSPYYFRNQTVALKTIQSFYGVNNGLNGYGEARSYIIDDGGIKRQRSRSYKCYETCGFLKTTAGECQDSSENLRKYYVEKFEKISAELSECTASAKCTNEEEATFDMQVDNDVMKDKNPDDQSSWSSQNKTSANNTCLTPTGDVKMFIPLDSDKETSKDALCALNGINGICYGKDNPEYWQHYKTTITFPGTWIDLKSAKRYYHEDKVNKDNTREKENYYCTGYDFEPVNEQWWNWKINNKGDINTIKVERPDNIKTNIRNFGKYSWNIDLNCFYALSNQVDPDDPGDSGDNTTPPPTTEEKNECSNENSTALCNTVFRPVEQQLLFPASDGINQREVGFNWTSAATDKVAAGTSYGIDPGNYAETLQEEAKGNPDSVYSGTADYTVHLTKENIKNLRSYAKKYGYISYQGNNKNESPEKVEGLYYYKSNIFYDPTYTTDAVVNTRIGFNNN